MLRAAPYQRPPFPAKLRELRRFPLQTAHNHAVCIILVLIIHLHHPAMMTRYGWGVVRAQA